jgi:hypothetical protein
MLGRLLVIFLHFHVFYGDESFQSISGSGHFLVGFLLAEIDVDFV